MKRALTLVLSFATAGLIACPNKEEGRKPSSEPGVSSGEPSNAAAEANIGTSGGTTPAPVGATATPVGATAAIKDEPAAAEGVACDGAPAWTKLTVCKKDQDVFAVGNASGIKDPSLARSSAAGRARGALVTALMKPGDGTFVMKSTEVVDTFSCKEGTFALAKAPSSEGASALGNCDGAAIAARSTPHKGCPEWANRLSWRDGSQIAAVGMVDNVKSHDLAVQSALNRARAEIASSVEHEITRKGPSVTNKAVAGGGLQEIEQKEGECDGAVVVMLKAAVK